MHPGADARGVGPIRAGVSAQPRFGCAVTTFAGDAFIRTRARSQACLGNGLKRGMTNGAARARLRLRGADRLADASRPRIEQNCVSASVKIFLRPGDVLAPFLASAAMTTGRSTSNRADEFRVGFGGLLNVLREGSCARND